MTLIVKENGNGPGIPPIDPGLYHAVCVSIFDLGTQKGGDFGKGVKMQRKAYVEWEIPDERIDLEVDGKTVNVPRKQRQKYTLSLSDKATLRKHLDAWRGRPFTPEELEGFDVLKLIGANCLLNLIHKQAEDGSGKIYANIASISPLMKGTPKRAPESKTVFFSFDDGVLPGDDVPGWIRKIMEGSPEYRALSGAKPAQAGNAPPPFDDDDLGQDFPSEPSGMDDMPGNGPAPEQISLDGLERFLAGVADLAELKAEFNTIKADPRYKDSDKVAIKSIFDARIAQLTEKEA